MTDSRFVIGIDGGGSTVRVAIVTPDLSIVAQAKSTTANPNVAGYDTATQTIQSAVMQALKSANLSANQIDAVGIGIAGAESQREGTWLASVVRGVLPTSAIALSSDHEIALTGAIGSPHGILILAGTGSIAYGVNSQGKSVLIGGWGWLLGDEGSGYWLGLHALKATIRAFEGSGRPTSLQEPILAQYGLKSRNEIILWAYNSSRQKDIAALAPIVLEHAQAKDPIAITLVETAAYDLSVKVATIRHQLNMENLPIAFAGSLLTNDTPLSALLCDLLKLNKRPEPKHSAVIGAAILALNKRP